MTILRNTAKAACLMVAILVIALVIIIGIGLIKLGKAFQIEQAMISPYVKDIIPAEREPAFWYLSPVGDRLLYNIVTRQDQANVRFLVINQEFTIANCSRFSWLDNKTIYCHKYQDSYYMPSAVIGNISSSTDTLQISSIKELTAEQVELESLLKQAKHIYRLQPSSKPDTLLVLAAEQQGNEAKYYHITKIENMDEVLNGFAYAVISLGGYLRTKILEPVYSPNGKHYYLLQNNTLEIYDVTSDELLVEYRPYSYPGFYFEIGGDFPNETNGWAADNSGVYFRIHIPSGFGPPSPAQPIQKLCIPGVSCYPVNN